MASSSVWWLAETLVRFQRAKSVARSHSLGSFRQCSLGVGLPETQRLADPSLSRASLSFVSVRLFAESSLALSPALSHLSGWIFCCSFHAVAAECLSSATCPTNVKSPR